LSSMSIFTKINSSQIGLVGHSLGGMVALMNAALDKRFKVTVTWAGLVNFSASYFGIREDHLFMKYIPSKIINKTNPTNLMIIHSIYDSTVPYNENALVAQNLTDCKLDSINYHMFGGPHYLFSDKVIIDTINWFELNFFKSETKNGPIELSYVITYILLGLSLLGLTLTTIAIMKYLFKYFAIKDYSKEINEFEKVSQKQRSKKIKDTIIVLLLYIAFLSLWSLSLQYIGINSLFFVPIVVLLLYFALIFLKYIITAKVKGEKLSLYTRLRLVDEIKSQFHKNVLLYSLVSTGIFLLFYFTFSLLYPFGFFTPVHLLSYILTFEIYPLYLAFELFYRKIIYPRLDFIKSPKYKTIITALMETANIFILISFSWNLFLITATLATYLIFLVVMVMNSIIYERTNKFSSVMLSSFIIIQIFFGSITSTILGFGSIAHLLHV
ncbi:MAG: alpha/beta hydrolase family protein, partial [Promethearchaeota archaeon]